MNVNRFPILTMRSSTWVGGPDRAQRLRPDWLFTGLITLSNPSSVVVRKAVDVGIFY